MDVKRAQLKEDGFEIGWFLAIFNQLSMLVGKPTGKRHNVSSLGTEYPREVIENEKMFLCCIKQDDPLFFRENTITRD